VNLILARAPFSGRDLRHFCEEDCHLTWKGWRSSDFAETPFVLLIIPAYTGQIIGLNGAIFPESHHVFVPNSELRQLKKETVNGIFR
jgi:hypothetical protein